MKHLALEGHRNATITLAALLAAIGLLNSCANAQIVTGFNERNFDLFGELVDTWTVDGYTCEADEIRGKHQYLKKSRRALSGSGLTVRSAEYDLRYATSWDEAENKGSRIISSPTLAANSSAESSSNSASC
jgi:hypothetical protein